MHHMEIIKTAQKWSQSYWYWLTYIVGGLVLLAVALFFQYGLEEQPCVVCIQIRLWISLLVIVAIIGLLLREKPWFNVASQLSVLLVAAGLVERSYLLLGTERGFIFADCGFNAGLPAWFAIEQWLPWLYQVEASCGYTPEIIFGITMAESLMLISVCLAIVSVCMVYASWLAALKK